jgi:transcriptional regulator with XRE-family HTH domain
MKQQPWGPFTHSIQDAIKRKALARNKNKPIKKTLFSQRLAFLRKSSGLTMVALGEKTGVTASYISLLEAGDRQPSKDLLQRLADIFFGPDNLAAAEELMNLAGMHVSSSEQQLNTQQIYERALQQNPDDFHSFSGLIRTLIRQQALDEAEKYILEGMKRFRDAWRLQALIAQLQLSLENYTVAATAQQKAIELYLSATEAKDGNAEEQADLYTNLGVIYFLWGMHAFQRRNQAISEGDLQAEETLEKECREHFITAQKAYKQAMTLNSEDVFLLDEYARICFNIADLSPPEQQAESWSLAIHELSRVLSSPEVTLLGLSQVRETSVFLAHAHSKAQRFEEAHHLLSVMQACHPNEWLAHYARVCFYSLQAQYYEHLKLKKWKPKVQESLALGLAALERVLNLSHPDNQTVEQALYDQDLAFLRDRCTKAFLALLKPKERSK